MNDQEPILEVQNLSAGYGQQTVIEDISFSLCPGEILSVVGESGCGKSTLLRALTQTDPVVRTFGGSVVLQGQDLSRLPPKKCRAYCAARLGMVFQNPGSSFNPIRSYRVQFAEALKSHGRYDKAAFLPQVTESFRKLGLTDVERILSSCPFALSGGMNQRVALALVLMLGQRVLLSDEPTSALDAGVQLQVAKELKELSRRDGVAQLVVTHDLALARFLSHRIAVLYAGRIVEFGDTAQVLTHPVHPYTRALMAAIPHVGGSLPRGLEGMPPRNGPGLPGCAFANRCPEAKADCSVQKRPLKEVAPGHYAACGSAEGGWTL